MKKLLLILFCVSVAQAGTGSIQSATPYSTTVTFPVNFAAASAAASDSTSPHASPYTNTQMTVISQPNTALVCVIGWDTTYTTPGTITVAWDSTGTNQAMTEVAEANESDNAVSCQIWGLIAPTVGNKTLSIAWTVGSHEVITWCVEYYGVNQTGISSAFINSNTATGSSVTPAITITTKVGDMTMDFGNVANVVPPVLTSSNRWPMFSTLGDGTNNPFGAIASGYSTSNQHQWTIATNPWVECGIDLASTGNTGTNTYNGSLQSVSGTGQVTAQ